MRNAKDAAASAEHGGAGTVIIASVTRGSVTVGASHLSKRRTLGCLMNTSMGVVEDS